MLAETAERMVMKSDIEFLLMYLDRDVPLWTDQGLAEALTRIACDFDIDLDEYISNDLLDYVHMYQVENSIE